MGEQIAGRTFTREDRQRYRDKVHRCLDVFARMLGEEQFEFDEPLTGMEVELNLVERDGRPALRNSEVLERIDDPAFVQELGRFNLEINVPPKNLGGDGAMQYEFEVRDQLNAANEKAAEVDAGMVMIGILPTLQPEQMTHETISSNPRYALLDEQMLLARGEDLQIDIRGGPEHLETFADSIAPEAACTSVQFHLQVSPEEFAQNWNAAQCLAAAQVGLGANSPYFLGRELWRETRISLFSQATDTRPAELKAQGVRPRVWFGERWITSVFDLFEENITYFPALLPVIDDEDPVAELDAGRHAGSARAAAAQRHGVALEPPRVRRRRRQAAPARGEPRASRRADRRRHHGQRRPVLRSAARAGRAGAAGVVADVVRRRRGELPHRGPARAGGDRLLAEHRRDLRDPSSRCASCCLSRTRGSGSGEWTTRSASACSASSTDDAPPAAMARAGRSTACTRSSARACRGGRPCVA